MRTLAEGIGDMPTDTFWKYFYEIFETIPRQGPGSRESTERALRMLPSLEGGQRILDIGCGAGTQTIHLAGLTEAKIVAVDNHPPFVDLLAKRVSDSNLETKITTQVGDMTELRFPDGSFDVIWSEGAIFIIGFSEGLARWRRLLTPGGHMVVSEFCWFDDSPPAELKEMFMEGDWEVGNVEARRQSIAANGYRLVGDFVLPAAGWWENYYVPLAECLERFRQRHAGNPDALAVAERSQREIELYQKYPEAFGYVFFVMQQEDSG